MRFLVGRKIGVDKTRARVVAIHHNPTNTNSKTRGRSDEESQYKENGGKIKNNNSLLLLYHGNKISTMFRITPSPLFNRWLIDSGCGIKIYV